MSSGLRGQRIPWSVGAFAQADQGIRCPFKESSDITECIDIQQSLRWNFADAQVVLFWYASKKPLCLMQLIGPCTDTKQKPFVLTERPACAICQNYLTCNGKMYYWTFAPRKDKKSACTSEQYDQSLCCAYFWYYECFYRRSSKTDQTAWMRSWS